MQEKKEKTFIEELSFFVRARRKELKMSQQSLALMAYGDEAMQSKVSAMENFKVEGVNTETIQRLLDALNSKVVFVKRDFDDSEHTFRFQIIPKKHKVEKSKESNDEYCECTDPFNIPGGNCMTCGKPLRL